MNFNGVLEEVSLFQYETASLLCSLSRESPNRASDDRAPAAPFRFDAERMMHLLPRRLSFAHSSSRGFLLNILGLVLTPAFATGRSRLGVLILEAGSSARDGGEPRPGSAPAAIASQIPLPGLC
jgi:hypothetical protein